MLILVDTSVLVRTVEPGHARHLDATASLLKLSDDGHALCAVPQVYYEFWVVATRPIANNGLGMTADEAKASLENLGPPLFRFLRDERAIYEPWYELVSRYQVLGKPAHDARLVAAMLRHGLTHVLTFNGRDFTRYNEIAVLEPAAVIATS
ncbi:MAG TPA: PIN domain-containing protein [Pirellulales bacterium]|jgi:predicted nucleic acid-binding protein|nr:PIN domain-containing protein [Pirellulales bacterium]